MVGQCVPQPRGQGSPSAHNYASVNPPPLDLGGHGRSVTGGSCEIPEYRALFHASPVGSYLWITAPSHPLSGLRSEEHTSELQSRGHLVCRLLLEKKKKITTTRNSTEE